MGTNASYADAELKTDTEMTNTYPQYSLGNDSPKKRSPEVNKVLCQEIMSQGTSLASLPGFQKLCLTIENFLPFGKIFFNILGKVARGNR